MDYFQLRALAVAKEPENPEGCQDAWGADPQQGIAIAADGVTSALFSGPWARMLVAGALTDYPDTTSVEAFLPWLQSRRAEWETFVTGIQLEWHQQPKLQNGAFTTFVLAKATPMEQTEPGVNNYMLSVSALGDTMAFLIRDGKPLWSFPWTHSSELSAKPLVVGSRNLGRDNMLQFTQSVETVVSGDLLILCTDALATWALRQYEAGELVDWDLIWTIPEDEWTEHVIAMRANATLQVDDTTLVMARFQ